MDGAEHFAGADINSRCAGLLDGPVAQTQAPVSLSGHVDSSLVSSSQVARNCGTLLMGIEPETLSPLVTNERDTGHGTWDQASKRAHGSTDALAYFCC